MIAPDAALYEQYNIITRANGFLIADDDGHALILSERAMPHYVIDEAASEALLTLARLAEQLRRGLVEAYKAGAPEGGVSGEVGG